ncbi:MAG: hypothetical protein IJ523_07595 [Succinivibrionaceae bacterium]|nr:hypothetical protein [Succinivibrionaceae bacterium]
MKIAVQCMIGTHKAQCEDHALVYEFDSVQTRLFNQVRCQVETSGPLLLGVADGVGGNPGAHQASRYSLGVFPDFWRKLEKTDDRAQLLDLLRGINRGLIDYSADIPGKESMATTFSAVYIDDARCQLVHTGNTRISVMHSRYLKQVTTDFTTYQYLLDQGNIEAAERCNRCEIISCLGGGDERNLSRAEFKTVFGPDQGRAPRLVLLTSDGVHEFLELDRMEEILSDDATDDLEKTDILIREALDAGSADDKTAVIIRI